MNWLLIAFVLLLPLAATLPFFGARIAQQGFQGAAQRTIELIERRIQRRLCVCGGASDYVLYSRLAEGLACTESASSACLLGDYEGAA